MRTLGLSPKAVLAFLFPAIATALAAIGSWIVTGNFDASEIRVALSGEIASGTALLGAYVGKPGNVVTQSGAPVPTVPPGLNG